MPKHLLPLLLCLAALPAGRAADPPIERIELPPGFSIGLFATGIEDARSLALGEKGTVFVGTRSAGKVYALVDRDAAGRADEVITLASGLNSPNGVAFRNGALFVAEIDRILRFDDIEANLKKPPAPVVVSDRFPHDGHHGWKFIAFGPDGKLYVPVGAPCNICEPDPDRYAVITRMNLDGSGFEVFARGIRNSVGFDWDPRTGELWFNDHGRDWLGDELPSDELNHAPRAGMHFGYPYCHQGDTPDPEYGHRRSCAEFTPPALKEGAHVAPDGLRFYTGRMFPSQYRNRIFIAQHGSWNRHKKSGYRVMSVSLANGKVEKYEVFAQGWMRNEQAWGRPVDLLVMPDGALLISDDQAGAIYRVTYSK
ncbi:MAG TPA: sorbosone dehydrogenase family protein [Burkholderiales bacterium]|nr:sorbosone dehydrogenase family protein [Burkholderiales bacterium]